MNTAPGRPPVPPPPPGLYSADRRWRSWEGIVAKRFGAEGYQFEIVEGWPQIEVKGVAASVALDSRGRVYVGVRNIPEGGGIGNILPGVGTILVLNSDGSYLTDWGNTFSSPHAVWIGPDDEIFVADTGRHTITKHMPSGAVQAPNGDIVISDGYGQNWMHRFSATGEHILSWGGGDPVFIQKFRD